MSTEGISTPYHQKKYKPNSCVDKDTTAVETKTQQLWKQDITAVDTKTQQLWKQDTTPVEAKTQQL